MPFSTIVHKNRKTCKVCEAVDFQILGLSEKFRVGSQILHFFKRKSKVANIAEIIFLFNPCLVHSKFVFIFRDYKFNYCIYPNLHRIYIETKDACYIGYKKTTDFNVKKIINLINLVWSLCTGKYDN